MAKSSHPVRRRGRPPLYAVPPSGTHVVKKYGNRRLYDTRTSRYVNLDELIELFVSENELQVVDAVSGADLTEKTLRQAILSEDEKSKRSLFPTPLLRALLRYRRGAARADFERHLTRAVATFAAARRS